MEDRRKCRSLNARRTIAQIRLSDITAPSEGTAEKRDHRLAAERWTSASKLSPMRRSSRPMSTS